MTGINLRQLITHNQKKAVLRKDLIDSFGAADAACNQIGNDIGIDFFHATMKLAEEVDDNEILESKLLLRTFIDQEINGLNDVLQTKSFDLTQMVYAQVREEAKKGKLTNEEELDAIANVEELIYEFIDADCKILSIYKKLPFDRILEQMNNPKINKKKVLKEIKNILSNGLGVSNLMTIRNQKLKEIELKITQLVSPKICH